MGASIAAGPHTTSTCVPGGACEALRWRRCRMPFGARSPWAAADPCYRPGPLRFRPAARLARSGDCWRITVRSCRRAALLQDRCGWPSVGVASSSQRRSRLVGRPPAKGRCGMRARLLSALSAPDGGMSPRRAAWWKGAVRHPASGHIRPQVRAFAVCPKGSAEWLRCKLSVSEPICKISSKISGLYQ